jgi:predicted flap endonuclease-1-like 5' DNA nuclease
MNITFTQDYQGYETGNEFYRTGAKATMPHGERLVALGVAFAGWGSAPTPQADPETVAPVRKSDDLTVIRGIGANTAADLASFGILTFADLAEADTDAVAAQLNGSSVRQVSGWQKQAQELL